MISLQMQSTVLPVSCAVVVSHIACPTAEGISFRRRTMHHPELKDLDALDVKPEKTKFPPKSKYSKQKKLIFTNRS